MLRKKLALLAGTAAALTAASAVFADGYYDSRGRYYSYSYPEHVIVERYEPYYEAPPAPVYYSAAPAYTYSEPAPSYYYSPAPSYYYAPSGAATGAVAGALIGGSLAHHDRGAAAAAGAILGGVIGSQYDRYSY